MKRGELVKLIVLQRTDTLPQECVLFWYTPAPNESVLKDIAHERQNVVLRKERGRIAACRAKSKASSFFTANETARLTDTMCQPPVFKGLEESLCTIQ